MARRRIEVEIIGDERDLVRATQRSGKAVAGMGATMEATGRKMTAVGRSMTRNITLPVVGLGIVATKMNLDFEKAMTNIRALVGASDKQMADYREGVLELAKTVPQGPQALADALYFVTSAGFSGAEALEVLEASAKAAAAGLGDTQGVADVVTSAVNVYGAANLKAAEATDVLLATVREGKAEPEELASVLGRVIAPAEALGVSFGEVGGAVAGLTLGGLDAAEAVTGLRGTLGTLLKPSQQARDTLEDAGLSVEGLRKQVADEGLLPALQGLRDRFGDNKDALGKLFPNVRALNAFLSLTGRNAKKNADAMESVTHAVGDTEKAFATAAESDAFKVQQAWSQLRAELISAGAEIVPAVVGVMGAVSGLAEAFGDLSEGSQTAILVVLGLAAALGPIVGLVGNIILAVKGLGTALAFMTGPIGLIVFGLGLATAAVIVASQETDRFADSQKRAADAMRALTDQAHGVKDAGLALRSARNAEVGSTLALKDAEKALGAARKTGDKTEVRRAEYQLEQARISHKQAIRGVERAEEELSAQHGKHRKVTREAKDAVGKLATEYENLRQKTGKAKNEMTTMGSRGERQGRLNAASDIAKISANMGELSNKAAKVEGNLRKTNPQLSATADNASKAAGATSVLVWQLGRLPTQKEINIFIREVHSSDTIEEQRAGGNVKKNAFGTRDDIGGLSWVGERGPELMRVPRGADIYTARESRSIVRGGGGGAQIVEGVLELRNGKAYIRGIIDEDNSLRGQRAAQTVRMGGGA